MPGGGYNFQLTFFGAGRAGIVATGFDFEEIALQQLVLGCIFPIIRLNIAADLLKCDGVLPLLRADYLHV